MAPDDLDDVGIARLLEIPKTVKHRPKKARSKPGHHQWEWQIDSVDGVYCFAVYARLSQDNPEDFSCGIRWVMPTGEDLILMRCNGPSHIHVNRLERSRLEFIAHRHLATERYLRAGLSVDGYAEPCAEFMTISQALQVVARKCSIEGTMVLPLPDLGDPELGL